MGRPVSAGASDGYHSGCLVCGACCQCRPSSVPGLICPGRHPRRLTIAMSTAVGFGLGDSVPCSTLFPRCLPTPDNTGCCLRPTRPSCSPFSSPAPSHPPTTAADSSHNRHSAPHDTGGGVNRRAQGCALCRCSLGSTYRKSQNPRSPCATSAPDKAGIGCWYGTWWVMSVHVGGLGGGP